MTAWVVVCVLSLFAVTRHVIRARRAAAQPPFVSWVRYDASTQAAPPSQATTDATRARDYGGLAWTKLDDLQLERLLSESSS